VGVGYVGWQGEEDRDILVTVGTFEGSESVVRALVYSQCTCDGKRLSTTWVVADIWLCYTSERGFLGATSHGRTFMGMPSHVLL